MLNETQRQALVGYLNFPLSDIMENKDVSPRQALIAMQALYELFDTGREDIYNQHRQAFYTLDILGSINQIIDIYKHLHPQNRTTNYPYFGAPTDETMIVYKNQNGVKAYEKKGLLSLSVQNDNTNANAPVTKADVIRFICGILQQRIKLLEGKAKIHQLEKEHRIKQDALYGQKLKLEEYKKHHFKHGEQFGNLQKRYEDAEIELDQIKRRMQESQRNSPTTRPQQNISSSPLSLEALKREAGKNYALAKSAIFRGKNKEAIDLLFLSKRSFKKLKQAGIDCDRMLRKIKAKLTELKPRVIPGDSIQPVLSVLPRPSQPLPPPSGNPFQMAQGILRTSLAQPPLMRNISLENLNPRCIKTLKGHSDSVYSVSWSSDGKFIASGSSDNTVIIWDVKKVTLVHTLKGHYNPVTSVCWSPGGKFIASGGFDNTVRIWDAKKGTLVHTLAPRGSDYVYSVSWSPSGKFVASGSGDHTVRIWKLIY